MQADAKVLDYLNTVLSYELGAMEQYFVHARMYQNWGFNQLYTRIDHEVDDERQHASLVLERLLMLGGQPSPAATRVLNIGSDVPGMLANDLALEQHGVVLLREAMAYCEQVGDYVTRSVLHVLLKDTEQDHLFWLEQQLGLIDKLGLENYLQSQQ